MHYWPWVGSFSFSPGADQVGDLVQRRDAASYLGRIRSVIAPA